ncbi:PAS domain-containing protein [Methylobacterium durans]|uniref:PAS domain-containing protein n=1 Tax=Methylobacterium durans TaxID=2202825 RepID=UPI002AFFA488|nr:PAS domain-containing protein [Methylobacterium durans]MEA1834282.1 PAS domain-containing protein [Methylobacterium durans]
MTGLEVICAFAHDSAVAIVITDAMVEKPGPTILYANESFARLVGRPSADLVGMSPRFMQGRETRRPVLDQFALALASAERFHGFLTNHRADGTKYVAEIDCRPLRNAEGRVEYFLAFEREVVRRRGRPWGGVASRFEPASIEEDASTQTLRRLGVFERN